MMHGQHNIKIHNADFVKSKHNVKRNKAVLTALVV
jgi:hypothetical protein